MKLEFEQAAPEATRPVSLKVETASAADDAFAESDDDAENIDANVHPVKTGRFSKKEKLRSKRGPKVGKGRASRKEKPASATVERGLRKAAAQAVRQPSTLSSGFVPGQGRTYSSSDPDEVDDDSILHEVLTRTPPALLAPIVVPRMSAVIDEPPRVLDAPRTHSPSISMDSWAPSDSTARFDDVEEDRSSGFLALTPLRQQPEVEKCANGHDDTPIPSIRRGELPPIVEDDALFQSSGSLNAQAGLRNKRKSKPFPPSFPGYDSGDPDISPSSAYSGSVPSTIDDFAPADLAIPKASQIRLESIGASSEEVTVAKTTAEDLFRIHPPTTNTANNQRLDHANLAFIPQKDPAAGPSGIVRRASTCTKRKTVSFHKEAPVIIEPNLRAPSRSLPRDVMLSREPDDEPEFKDALDVSLDSFSAMRIRDSVKLATSIIPSGLPTMDIPRRTNRELSDSSGGEDSFARMSRVARVSFRDKDAIREASKRQSQAVAKAMSQQIRGVPRSAMLAYADNEVVLSDDNNEEVKPIKVTAGGHLSFRRRSTKSIREPPRVEAGKVPVPPPPPPFVPEPGRVRSNLRKAPPPPSAATSS